MMITGDLVKCNITGSIGVMARISEYTSASNITAIDLKVLWPEGSMTWENVITVTPIADEEYKA